MHALMQEKSNPRIEHNILLMENIVISELKPKGHFDLTILLEITRLAYWILR